MVAVVFEGRVVARVSTIDRHMIGLIVDRLGAHGGVEVSGLGLEPVVGLKNDRVPFLKSDCQTDRRSP